jgi:hypothetical protein
MRREMSYNHLMYMPGVKGPNLSTLISRRRLHSISTTRRHLSVTDRLTYRCQAWNVHVVSHVAHPARRQVGVALSPVGFSPARKRRGGPQ